jgi:hypothetical protein
LLLHPSIQEKPARIKRGKEKQKESDDSHVLPSKNLPSIQLYSTFIPKSWSSVRHPQENPIKKIDLEKEKEKEKEK